jgi:hypothetical protein
VVPLSAALLLVGVAAAQHGLVTPNLDLWSWMSAVLGTVFVAVLLVPATVCAIRRRRAADGWRLLPRTFVLGLVPSLVSLPLLAAYTSSAPVWGASGASLGPALFVSVLAALEWVRGSGRVGKAVVATIVIGSLATVHTATSFRDGPPGNLVAAVGHGAFAGLRTTEAKKVQIADATKALRACGGPGTGVLDYMTPAAFLFGDVRFDTPIVWLDDFRASNSYVVDWIERTDRVARCIVAPSNVLPRRLTQQRALNGDPLLRWISERYSEVASGGGFVVYRRLAAPAATPSVVER